MSKEKKSFIEKYVKIIVVFAVIAGSSSGIFGSAIQAPSMAIGFWRLTLGMPFFAIPALMNNREEMKTISKKSYMWAFISGFFLFAHFYTWFNAVKFTDIASASTLAALHPLIVLVVTVFIFRRKVSIRAVMGIMLALLGGAMVAGFDYKAISPDDLKGDILAFLAAMFMGLYFTIGNEVRKEVSGSTYVFLVFFGCWFCFAVGMITAGTDFFGYSTRDYILIVGLTLVCQIGAHAVFNLCLGHVDSLYVSTWESGEAVMAILQGVIFLGQTPTQIEIIGCAVVVTGLLFYNYNLAKFEKETAAAEAALHMDEN